jgi:hypothetical protein
MEVIAGGPSDALLLRVPDTRVIGQTLSNRASLAAEEDVFAREASRASVIVLT